MGANNGTNSPFQNGSPRSETNPSRFSENTQLQWLIESVSQLKTSHDKLTGSVEHKFECLTTKIDARNLALDERIDSKYKTTEEKIINHNQLMRAQMESMELKIHKAIADSKIDGIKWAIGLAVGFPSVAWMIIQIVKVFTTK